MLGAIGVLAGFPLADPLVGLGITVAILVVLKSAWTDVYRRLMDAIDPELLVTAETTLRGTPGVTAIEDLRLRWTGHRIRAETSVVVDPSLTLADAHAIAHDAHHRLSDSLPKLHSATVHVSPAGADPAQLRRRRAVRAYARAAVDELGDRDGFVGAVGLGGDRAGAEDDDGYAEIAGDVPAVAGRGPAAQREIGTAGIDPGGLGDADEVGVGRGLEGGHLHRHLEVDGQPAVLQPERRDAVTEIVEYGGRRLAGEQPAIGDDRRTRPGRSNRRCRR